MIWDDAKYNAIELLLTGAYTRVEVAQRCGVSKQSIHNWLNDAEFKAELDRRLSQKKDNAVNHLTDQLAPVVNRIIDIALDTKNPDSLKACKYICDRVLGTPKGAAEDAEQELERTNGAEALTVFTTTLMAAKDKAKAQKRA